jgi:hypothetical protein
MFTPGTLIDFTPVDHPDNKGTTMLVHASFSLKKIVNPEDVYDDLPEDGDGVLVEHLGTGFFFVLYEEDGLLDSQPVLDFSGTPDKPKKIYLSTWDFEEFDRWVPTKPTSEGTRIGGIPLNSDGTPYTGPWPGAEDGKFSFVGQYRLKDGRYVYLFSNDDAENYDYSDDDIDSGEDSYTVALVEDGPIPARVLIQEAGERKISSPKNAYKQRTPKSVKQYPPLWAQGDATPDDPDYEFLLQYGPDSTYDGDSINENFHSECYLFWNPKTDETKLLMQSD